MGRKEFTNLTIKNKVTIAKGQSTQSNWPGTNAIMKAWKDRKPKKESAENKDEDLKTLVGAEC